MPIREYICTTVECPENIGHFPTSHRIIEKLVGMNETPDCEACNQPLKQVINEGPAGYVKGSQTPCHKKV